MLIKIIKHHIKDGSIEIITKHEIKRIQLLKIIKIDNKSQPYSEIKIEIERIIFVNFIKDNLNKLRNEINRICFWSR
jgi:hypothetical protein